MRFVRNPTIKKRHTDVKQDMSLNIHDKGSRRGIYSRESLF